MTCIWKPSTDIADIWEEILTILPSAEDVICSVAERISSFDSRVWQAMSTERHIGRRDNYLIRFTLPLVEINGWNSSNQSTVIDALAAHFFWAICWRQLDNVLDQNSIDHGSIGDLAVAMFRAANAHRAACVVFDQEQSDEIIALIHTLSETAALERVTPVPRDLIWKRATPFLVVPKTLMRFNEGQLSIYKSYINLNGLGHDIHDFLNDIRLGIASLPLSWYSEIDPEMNFRRDIVNAWYAKAHKELLEAELDFGDRIQGREYTLLSYFLHEAEQLRESLGAHSLPR